jgi:hypothetical protein
MEWERSTMKGKRFHSKIMAVFHRRWYTLTQHKSQDSHYFTIRKPGKKNKLQVLADQSYLLQQLHITCSPPRSINGLRNGFVENPAFINLRCQMTKLMLSGKFHHLVLRSRISTFMAYKPRRRVIFLRVLLY